MYLSGGTVYASAIDENDFTWNSGTLYLDGGTYSSLYGLASGSDKYLWQINGATLNQTSLTIIPPDNQLVLFEGNLNVEGDLDASSVRIFDMANIEVGGTLSGITALSDILLWGEAEETSLTLNGPNASWDTGNDDLDTSGIGINVINGGSLLSAGGTIDGSLGTRTVTVSGIGSQWIMGGGLSLGMSSAQNGLVITNSALVLCKGVVTGERFMGGNTIKVSGKGSRLDTGSGGILLGRDGGSENQVIVEDGGNISSATVQLGDYRNSWRNRVKVTGIGSQWNIDGNIYVGIGGGRNRMLIEDGGIVSNETACIGLASGSSLGQESEVRVTGEGSLWHNEGSLTVGCLEAPDCSLLVTEGGRVDNTDGIIGINGNNCLALVSGAGSLWNNSGTLAIGNDRYYTGSRVVITNGGELVLGSTLVIEGMDNTLNLEQGGRLTVNASFDGSLAGFNFNAGSTLSVFGRLTGLPTLEADRRLEATSAIGDMTVHGTYAPISNLAESMMDGNLTIADEGTLEMEIGGKLPFLEHDQLTVNGSAMLAGVLEVVFVNGYIPTNEASFQLFNWPGGAAGFFTSVNLPILPSELEWDISHLYTKGVLSVISVIRISEIYSPAINLKSKGRTPVTVFSTDNFDATTIDPSLVRFAMATPVHHSFKDEDRDGDVDLKLQFRTQDLDVAPADTEAVLIGQTDSGAFVIGVASVKILPNK